MVTEVPLEGATDFKKENKNAHCNNNNNNSWNIMGFFLEVNIFHHQLMD